MKHAEIGVTVAYFALCIAIALYFRKRAAAGSSAFLAAERGIGVWVNGFGTFSTLVSAASFLGFLGMTCEFGWSFMAIALGVAPTLGFVFSMLLISGPLRRYSERTGQYTLSGFLTERYGPAAGTTSSLLIILIFSAYIVPQLLGSGRVVEYMLGISPQTAVTVMGVIFVFYVLMGGMLSVTWNDFVQGILMFAVMVGLGVTAIVHFGGVSSLAEGATAVKPHFMDVDPKVSIWTRIGFPLGATVFALSSAHTVMRLFTAKDVRQGRAALSLAATLSLVHHLVGYFGVAAAALLFIPTLTDYDSAYLVALNNLFPAWARGLGVAGLLAAIMSTTAGMLLTAGAEFSQNLYKISVRPQATDREMIRAAQGMMLFIGALTIVLARSETDSIGTLVGQLVQAMGSSFAAPLVAGIWWKRANAWGGFLGIAGGFLVYLAAHYGGVPERMGQFSEILFSFPASILGLVMGSLMSSPPSREKARLVESLHREERPSSPGLDLALQGGDSGSPLVPESPQGIDHRRIRR